MALHASHGALDICAFRIDGLIKWQRDNKGKDDGR